MLKKLLIACGLIVVISLGVHSISMASNSATQTVSFSVSAINEISVSGNPSALTVDAATAGSQPNAASDTSTSYSITTNESSKKITAAINTAMPSGVTLSINLSAPSGATSAGATALTATAAHVVTGISQVAQGSIGITYSLSATVSAGTMSSSNKTVTLTLTDGA